MKIFKFLVALISFSVVQSNMCMYYVNKAKTAALAAAQSLLTPSSETQADLNYKKAMAKAEKTEETQPEQGFELIDESIFLSPLMKARTLDQAQDLTKDRKTLIAQDVDGKTAYQIFKEKMRSASDFKERQEYRNISNYIKSEALKVGYTLSQIMGKIRATPEVTHAIASDDVITLTNYLDEHDDETVDALDENNETLLLLAAKRNALRCALELIYRGADINFQSPIDGYTPLMHAVVTNNTELIKLLFTRRVNWKLTNIYGENANDISLRMEILGTPVADPDMSLTDV